MSVEINRTEVSVEIQRTEVVLNNRGARGVNGTVLVTSAAGQTVDSRLGLAAIASPSSGQAAILVESGREGMFVFDTSNLNTAVADDTGQGIYVPPSSDTSGASGAWVRTHDGAYNVKWFGARGDSDATGVTGTDDTAAIQAAINFINGLGGGELFFPAGYYKVSSYLTICKKLTVRGAGQAASVIVATHAGGGGASSDQNVRNGSIFYSNWTSNSSTALFASFADIQLKSANAANVGAGFYDNGGSFISFQRCAVAGFKYGIVFDQTELSDIDLCDIEGQTTAGVWLVNGADLKAGNIGGFTNRISVNRCQFNHASTAYNVVDDGGNSHAFTDNNHNNGLNYIRAAGVDCLVVRGGEFEGSHGDGITLNGTTLAGGAAAGGAASIGGMLLVAGLGHACVSIAAGGGNVEIGGGALFSSNVANIQGCSNCAFLMIGHVKNVGTGALTDGTKATVHVNLLGIGNGPVLYKYSLGTTTFVADSSSSSVTVDIQQFLVNLGAASEKATSYINPVGSIVGRSALGFDGTKCYYTFGYLYNGGYKTTETLRINPTDITVSGNVFLSPPAVATPSVNGQMTFQLTSNTSLVVKVKGSDGVVRSATLTLA